MIKALKALQDKIQALELERAAAAEKLHHLGQHADQHKQQHNVRQQLNKSSQYSTPPSDSSTEGEYTCTIHMCLCVCLCLCLYVCQCTCVLGYTV